MNIHNWFYQNIDYLFFIYGLSFLIMGIAIIILPKKESQFQLAKILWILAVYGFLHSVGDFVSIISEVKEETKHIVGLIFTSVSYLFLFEFGRRLLILSKRTIPWWILPACIVLTLTVSLATSDYLNSINIFVGYFVRFPAGIMVSIGFIYYYNSIKSEVIIKTIKHFFILASVSMFFWAIFCGIFRNEGDFFPANILNTTTFFEFTNFPIQLFRTIVAILTTIALFGILDIFKWETVYNIRSKHDALEIIVQERTEELQNLNTELECDIESRMETEKLLQKSEHRYRKLLENASDAIVIGDTNGYIIEINSKMEELTGFSNEELIGKHFSIFIPAEEMQVAKNSVENLKTHGFFKVIEGKIMQKNGTIVPVDLSGNIIEIDNQQIVQTIIHDIAEQQILKHKLLHISESQDAINSVLLLTIQTQKLDEILEKVLNILLSLKWLSLESKGCIFLVEDNPQELVLKVSKNLSNSLLQTCSIVPFGHCLCGRAALSHEIVFSDCYNTHENTYDGILSHGHYCIPILDNETLLGVINVDVKEKHIKKDEDVSFLKAYASLVAKIIIHYKTTSEIETLNKNLIERNKELEQFAYITSHDLQEPLRSITSFVDKIKSECTGKMDNKFNVYFNFITESTSRMSKLIHSVLEYSRLGKNRQLNKVNCNDLLSDIMTDISAIINESKATVEYKDLPIINALPVEMKQLFQNLIVNALKFRKKDIAPVIKIIAKKDDNFWLFAIQDNGIGINEKHKDKIFKIFQRLHDRAEYEGLGIGLAFCKKIVEFHNGKIWVESEIAQGSTFYFTIPNLEI